MCQNLFLQSILLEHYFIKNSFKNGQIAKLTVIMNSKEKIDSLDILKAQLCHLEGNPW